MSIKKLPLDGKAVLLEKMADDYLIYMDFGTPTCPNNQFFKIASRDEDLSIERDARIAALEELRIASSGPMSPIEKLAFDTRRIDEEHERNPRVNLQYWHRKDEFITESDEKKLKLFAKLMRSLSDIKKDFGAEPEWFESYARQLYDNVYRILRIKQADLDIFRPQMVYLEQLIFARYRLDMEELEAIGEKQLRGRLLEKDERLQKRGTYIRETGLPIPREKSGNDDGNQKIVIDGNVAGTQDSIVNAIFGNNQLRREGENTVERTITITIKDQVIE